MGKFSKALDKFEKKRVQSDGNKSLFFSENKTQAQNERPKGLSIVRNKIAKQPKLAPTLVTVTHPHNFECEQFRSLKTTLLFSSERGAPRKIMVTSAVPDEGKSFVSANLAVTFAQGVDEHVLLLDCDLRLPTVHKVFGIPDNSPGLSDLLAGKMTVPEVLYKTGVDKLSVLPGGNIPPNPTELISSKRMKNLLMELESRYKDRYIIIDSPPPLLTAEAIAISRQVDGIIVVIKHESTSRKDVKEMIDLLDKDKIIGVVVNRYDVRLAKYYGYGKYGAYYGRKDKEDTGIE